MWKNKIKGKNNPLKLEKKSKRRQFRKNSPSEKLFYHL